MRISDWSSDVCSSDLPHLIASSPSTHSWVKMFWIVWLRSATGTPVALTLETGKAMPSATTSGASFCAILRGFDTRTFTAFDFELFICKLLFIPIDTPSRRQRTNYHLKALPRSTKSRVGKEGV